MAKEFDVFVTGGTAYMGSRLIAAVENPPPSGKVQIVEVAGIRRASP